MGKVIGMFLGAFLGMALSAAEGLDIRSGLLEAPGVLIPSPGGTVDRLPPKGDTVLSERENRILNGYQILENMPPLRFEKRSDFAKEGFALKIGLPAVVTAGDYNGFLYGTQRFLQLCAQPRGYVPDSCVIWEQPAFPWRSVHLDVSRHFFEIPVIERLIRRMAGLRFNRLHLHLSDDQGWRFPVPGYPELTRRGAWRKGGGDNPDPYGGAYTVDELHRLVAFARDYGIEIMPEIDMPGHCRAAVAAYPEMSCAKKEEIVGFVRDNPPGCSTLCVSDSRTLAMTDSIVEALCDVFPFEVIHLGGDECEIQPWEECPSCQRMKKELSLKDTRDLQGVFMNRLGRKLAERGRRMAVWDEYADLPKENSAPSPLVFVWQSSERYEAVKKKGYEIIMVPANYLYLDYAQGIPMLEPWGDHTLRMEKVMKAPLPAGVLGGGSCLWAESVKDEAGINYMLFPRLFAVSEVLWHGDKRLSWDAFQKSALAALYALERRGVRGSSSLAQVTLFPALPVLPDSVRGVFVREAKSIETPVVFSLEGEKQMRVVQPNVPVEFPEEGAVVLRTADKSYVYGLRFGAGIGRLDTARSTQASAEYPGAASLMSLTDGITALAYYKDPNWVGFETHGKPVELYVDIPSGREIDWVTVEALQKINSWIIQPAGISVWAEDGTLLGKRDIIPYDPSAFGESVSRLFTVKLNRPYAGKIRVSVKPGVLPAVHPCAGQNAWLFLSEVTFKKSKEVEKREGL